MPSPVPCVSSSQGPSVTFMLAGVAAATLLVTGAGSKPEPGARYPADFRDAPANVDAPAARRFPFPPREQATRMLVARELQPIAQQPLRSLPRPAAYRGQPDAGSASPVAVPDDGDAFRQTFDGAAAQASGGFSARLKASGFSSGSLYGSAGLAGGSDAPAAQGAPTRTSALYGAPAGSQAPDSAGPNSTPQGRSDPRKPVVLGARWSASAAPGTDESAPSAGPAGGADSQGRAGWNNAAASANQTAAGLQSALSAAASGSSSHGAPGGVSGNAPGSPQSRAEADSADKADKTGGSESDAKTTTARSSGLTLKTLSLDGAADGAATDTGGTLIGASFNWERSQGLPINGMSTTQRLSACGLIAAEALQRFLAKKPNLDNILKIRDLALAHGLWTSGQGMHGPATEHELLTRMGVKADLVWVSGLSSIEQKLIGYLKQNKPVIISTPRHYFFVEGYADGKFFVGHTGEIMRGFDSAAGPRMTIQHISYAGNGIHALIVP